MLKQRGHSKNEFSFVLIAVRMHCTKFVTFGLKIRKIRTLSEFFANFHSHSTERTEVIQCVLNGNPVCVLDDNYHNCLLPDERHYCYNLRDRTHNRELHITSRLLDCNFLARLLFKDSY